MSVLDRGRLCPECGNSDVFSAGKDGDRFLLCFNCWCRFIDENGVLMTANRGPDPDKMSEQAFGRLWASDSERAGILAYRDYNDRMDSIVKEFYKFPTNYPGDNDDLKVFHWPFLWMAPMDPRDILRRARKADLTNPEPKQI